MGTCERSADHSHTYCIYIQLVELLEVSVLITLVVVLKTVGCAEDNPEDGLQEKVFPVSGYTRELHTFKPTTKDRGKKRGKKKREKERERTFLF